MKQLIKEGKPLYGESSMPEHIQEMSARNSRFAQLKFSKSIGIWKKEKRIWIWIWIGVVDVLFLARLDSLVQLCQPQQPWCRHFQVQQLRLDTTSNKKKQLCDRNRWMNLNTKCLGNNAWSIKAKQRHHHHPLCYWIEKKKEATRINVFHFVHEPHDIWSKRRGLRVYCHMWWSPQAPLLRMRVMVGSADKDSSNTIM